VGQGESNVLPFPGTVRTEGGDVGANWTNQTTFLTGSDGLPPAREGGLAYDPTLKGMVFFGGENSKGVPTNATWEYDGYRWTNVTPSVGGPVPALAGMGFAWDPAWGGVILTGGELTGGAVSNQTWLFNGTWHNETAKVSGSPNPTLDSPHEAFGATAYDGALDELVVVNGCVVPASCSTSRVGETYRLSGPSSTWTNLTFSAPAAPYPDNASGGSAGAELAYDPTLSELVYFGGGTAALTAENSTWILSKTGWFNVTSTSRGCAGPSDCPYYPGATAYGSMTWDGALQEVVMFGGLGATGVPSNQTWTFGGAGDWRPACVGTCPTPVPPVPEDSGAIASNSTDIAPLLLDGSCPTACEGDSWVYEVPPEPTVVSVSPNPTELGVSVKVTASNAVGAGSGPYLTGTIHDSAGASNMTNASPFTDSSVFDYTATFSFPAGGSYTVWAQEQDYFGVVGTSSTVDVPVNGTLSATPTATPNPTEVGTAVDFSAGVSPGTGVFPFTYAWTFGDGNVSTAADPTQLYPYPNTFTASVAVTDHLSQSVHPSLSILVYPKLTASAATNIPVTDSGVPVLFTGLASGGSGTYSAYHWDFGDKNSSAAQYVAHTYVSSAVHVYVAYFNVTDSAHFSASGKVSLQVNPPLSLSPIQPSSSSPTTSSGVRFSVAVHNGTPGYSYVWNFGDSTVSTNVTPTHSYHLPGTYTVSVVVEDRAGGVQRGELSVKVVQLSGRASILAWLSHGIGLYTFAAALAAAVFLAVVLFLGRKRRRAERTEQKEGGPGAPPGPPPPTRGEEPGGSDPDGPPDPST